MSLMRVTKWVYIKTFKNKIVIALVNVKFKELKDHLVQEYKNKNNEQ